MKFSENLYTLRKNKGISQEQLAELVNEIYSRIWK